MGGYTAQSADPCQQSASCRTTPGLRINAAALIYSRALAGFAAADSPCRNILGPWCASKPKPWQNSGLFETMKPDETALHVRGLTKRFDRLAVDALDLTVRSGEFYALLGPNGAGKTTTLRMVAGLLRPDSGEIRVFGIDALADPIGAKRIVAWLPDEPMLYDKLTPIEHLEFVAGLWSVDPRVAQRRADDLLDLLDLADS